MFPFLLFIGLVSLVLGCGEDTGELRWVQSTNNITPDGNFPYGVDSQGKYFVCKGEVDGITYGGSYLQTPAKEKVCRVVKNGTIAELTTFVVLVCAPSSIWTPAFNKIVPNNAFAVGSDIMCRGTSNNNPSIGSIGTITKCVEEGEEIICTETAVCNGIVYNRGVYIIGPFESFNVLTMTNTFISTNDDEEGESFALLNPKEANLISFNAKATEDITVAIVNDEVKENIIFEVLVGGLHNSITAVRTYKTGDKYANSSYTPYILEELSYAGYFLYWDKHTIAIGRAVKYPSVTPSRTPFLTFTSNELSLTGATKISLKSSKQAFWHISC